MSVTTVLYESSQYSCNMALFRSTVYQIKYIHGSFVRFGFIVLQFLIFVINLPILVRLVQLSLRQPCYHRGSEAILTDMDKIDLSLQLRHNERDGVSNHQPHDRLLNRLFRRRSRKTSKLRVTGLCAGNLPVTGEFPAQRASNAENVSIWWRHHVSSNHVLSW